eukprot:15471987-Alexandrium_andersonii.AAC.1
MQGSAGIPAGLDAQVSVIQNLLAGEASEPPLDGRGRHMQDTPEAEHPIPAPEAEHGFWGEALQHVIVEVMASTLPANQCCAMQTVLEVARYHNVLLQAESHESMLH